MRMMKWISLALALLLMMNGGFMALASDMEGEAEEVVSLAMQDAPEELNGFDLGPDGLASDENGVYHLVRDCRCVLHLVYWDTQVREVYRDLQSEREVLASLPHSRGGTDINAVYRWLRENKEEPDILLILTDGCFGTLTDPGFRPQMKARTVLILSERRYWSADMKRIGKVVELT